MPTTSVVADVSYGRASNIARAQEAAAAASATASAAPSGEAKIEFNQYNTSPKALSPVEIYRNTKSQISLAKEALKANAAH